MDDRNHSFLRMVWCLGFEVGSSGGVVAVFGFVEIEVHIGKVPQAMGIFVGIMIRGFSFDLRD